MKRIAWLAPLVVLAVSGCSATNKLIGTWEGELAIQNQKIRFIQTLNPDGTFVTTNTMDLMGNTVSSTSKGTWESDGESTLTMTAKEMEFDGPEQFKRFAENQAAATKDKPQTVTLKWNGKDEFTASNAAAPGAITFRRKK